MPGLPKWQLSFQGSVSRWTVPREAILDLLSQTSKHMSAKEIYTSLYQRHPSLGLTTSYRILDPLARMNIINKITLDDGQKRFEFKKWEKKTTITHHLYGVRQNLQLQRIRRRRTSHSKKTKENLAKKCNFKIMDHNIEFYGLCEKCN